MTCDLRITMGDLLIVNNMPDKFDDCQVKGSLDIYQTTSYELDRGHFYIQTICAPFPLYVSTIKYGHTFTDQVQNNVSKYLSFLLFEEIA